LVESRDPVALTVAFEPIALVLAVHFVTGTG